MRISFFHLYTHDSYDSWTPVWSTIGLPLAGQTSRTSKVLAALCSCLLHFSLLSWAAQAMVQIAPVSTVPIKVTLVQPPIPLSVGQGDLGPKVIESVRQAISSPSPPPQKLMRAAPAKPKPLSPVKSPSVERKIIRPIPPLAPPVAASTSALTTSIDDPQPDTNHKDEAGAENDEAGALARFGAETQGGNRRAHELSRDSREGNGHGEGSHGKDAQPDYSLNPKPPYPLVARRLGVQGLVLLRVLVRANGSVALVELAHSSGSPLLDSSAIQTVRDRWRFIPAQRQGEPVESWTEVPIRFVLTAS